jgi:hypothetical protein
MRPWATIAPMIPRLPVPALLVLVLSTLGALANASPPDPGWIGGFYDAADGDDVVLAVTGMDPAPPLAPVVDVAPHAMRLGPVTLPMPQAERPFALTVPAVRAPPPA